MKIKLLVSSLLLCLLLSCSSFDSDKLNYYKEVGYVYTTITNVNDRSISFANGLSARTNRIIIAVNSTPVLLVIENYTGSGYFYLRKHRVNFAGGGDIEMMGLNRGVVQYVFDLNKEKYTITLADGSKWQLPRKDDWDKVGGWLTDSEIIIPENRPPKGVFFINPATMQSVLALKLDKAGEEINEN